MRRLRVCQLITTLGVGGAERGLYELSRRLDRSRFDVRVAALRGGEVGQWLQAAGIGVTVLGLRGKWDVLKLSRLGQLLRHERIDLLHTHLFHADLAGRPAALAAAVPHVVHTVWTAEGRFRPWQFAYARLLSQACDRIICVSQSVREHHARRSGLPDHCYRVIPWGIDVAAFSRDQAARRRLRAAWDLANDQVLAAFVGRLETYKGVETLLAAIRLLAPRGGCLRFVIAGDGPMRQAAQDFLAHAEGGSHAWMLGHVRDVRAVLSAADLYVMPSHWEGWPLALGEAMAAGLPAVGSDVPGVRDLLIHERTGVLVPSQDAAALADAIERLAGDGKLRRRLGRAARNRIVQQFSIERTVAAHEALYDEIAGHLPDAASGQQRAASVVPLHPGRGDGVDR
jgi:glycosyltransferase involved in cell wall biosynthesis